MNNDLYIKDRSWVEVNIKNLQHNAKILQNAMQKKCALMAVVKANAYGHSAKEISLALNEIGVNAFAVATVDEGMELRKNGVTGEILILGFTDILRINDIKKYDLTQTIIDYDYAVLLNSADIKIKTHLKIDTGMHRLGIPHGDFESVKKVFEMKNLDVNGIFTHLCCSDSLRKDDVDYTNFQINNFYTLLGKLKSENIAVPKTHIQSTYGLLNYPKLKCDYARIGIALYGVLSSPENTALKLDLRPVLSLKSKIVLIRNTAKGESIGYSRTFTAKRNSKIAILPIGYADGLPRSMSNKNGKVLVNGCVAPIVGRVCMDQTAIDVTDVSVVAVGDTVSLIDDNSLLSAEVSKNIGTISNELLSRLGTRLPVKFIGSKEDNK